MSNRLLSMNGTNPAVDNQSSSPLSSYCSLSILIPLAVSVTMLRLWYLHYSGHNLFFDEAQYWLWSQDPAFGYYSKPPMLAWTIWFFTTLLGSDTEFAVRAASPIMHLLTTFVIYAIANKLSTKDIAFLAAATYLLMPAVTLSSSLMSTDSIFLFWWATAFYFFINALDANKLLYWVITGIACGMGILSKYTMVLFLLSALLYMLTTPSKRSLLLTYKPWLAAILSLLVFMPNIIWNYNHGFVSFLHTKDNAHLESELIHPDKFFEFIGAQFGVFGPILFGTLLIMFYRFKSVFKHDTYRLLLLFVIPFLGLISIISLLSRAHANWAAPIYITATIAVTLFLIQGGKRKLYFVSLALSFVVFILFLTFTPLANKGYITLSGKHTSIAPFSIKDPFKRLKGWEALGVSTHELLIYYPDAILVSDERKVIAELIYYVDKQRGFTSDFAYAKWNSNHKIQDHYELITDMNDHVGKSFLMITRTSHIDHYTSYFDSYELIQDIIIPAYSDDSIEYQAYLMHQFKGY